MKIALKKANKDGILDSKDANNIYEVYNMYGKEGLLSIRPSMPRAIQLMIDNIIGAPLPSGGRTPPDPGNVSMRLQERGKR